MQSSKLAVITGWSAENGTLNKLHAGADNTAITVPDRGVAEKMWISFFDEYFFTMLPSLYQPGITIALTKK